MCLGLPGQVIAVRGKVAEVDFWGLKKDIRLDEIAEAVAPGDYLVAHAGQAVRKVQPEEVADTLGMYEVILAECDPVIAEAVEEIEAAEEVLV